MVSLDIDVAIKTDQYKKEEVVTEEEKVKSWREKKMHGQCLKDLEQRLTGSVDIFGKWKWLKKITIGHSAANLPRKSKSVRINIYVLFQELTKGSIE